MDTLINLLILTIIVIILIVIIYQFSQSSTSQNLNLEKSQEELIEERVQEVLKTANKNAKVKSCRCSDLATWHPGQIQHKLRCPANLHCKLAN